MVVGAEISHFPIPKSLLRQHPEWQQKTIEGTSASEVRFCPNSPVPREYVVALFGDIAANYDVDYIQTCQLIYTNIENDEGASCFCEHCIARAREEGFDLETAITVLKKDWNAQPQKQQWIDFKTRSTTAFYKEIAEKIKEENPSCHLRFNDVLSWRTGAKAIDFGMDIRAVAPYLGSLVNQDHTEQLGVEGEDFSLRKEWLATNRELLGQEMHYLTGIAARMNASPALVKKGIKVALEHPSRVNGLVLKHYDGASFSLLRAFKQGMIEGGVKGIPPILGMEVEDMELDGFEIFREELVEEWGVETKGSGTASAVFSEASGTYGIRITYFDGEEGQSEVQLLVNGEKTASFYMDEDTDCWRWRLFRGIDLKRGDKIELRGSAHGKEGAILDFIEFIPG
jgi:hypothetical protein